LLGRLGICEDQGVRCVRCGSAVVEIEEKGHVNLVASSQHRLVPETNLERRVASFDDVRKRSEGVDPKPEIPKDYTENFAGCFDTFSGFPGNPPNSARQGQGNMPPSKENTQNDFWLIISFCFVSKRGKFLYTEHWAFRIEEQPVARARVILFMF
jgi:hypothetical protein